jgi:hypothetical protein
MGEYHWKSYEAKYLSDLGHDVHLLEQLNGRDYDEEYLNQIKELEPDIIYSTPADHKTFEVIEQIDCKKIINICSLGIMKNHINEWVDYHGKWWDEMFTNSAILHNVAKKITKSIHYEFPLVSIKNDKIEFTKTYEHDCVFLGQGFHRLQIPEFKKERETFFLRQHDFNFKVYGNGWPQVDWAGGVLPDGHIGKLYASAKSAVGVIEKDQRVYGLINNRYSEMGYCKVPIITYNYNDVDWFGADKYLNFITSYEEFKNVVYKCVNHDDNIVEKTNKFGKFMENQHNIYLEKLKEIIND